MLDIDRRLMVLFSFTVKLVSKIMRASWGSLCDFPKVHPIDVIASGGMFLTTFSYVTAIGAEPSNPLPDVTGVLLVDARRASRMNFDVRIVGRFSM